jgi:hypothetical protein
MVSLNRVKRILNVFKSSKSSLLKFRWQTLSLSPVWVVLHRQFPISSLDLSQGHIRRAA